jgi:hypothetical protein
VVEAGRRFADADFATTSWQLRRYLWAPKLKCFGIQRFHLLNDVLILAGPGVGGGSLVYANTLYPPPKPFFTDRQWSDITDWAAELAPSTPMLARPGRRDDPRTRKDPRNPPLDIPGSGVPELAPLEQAGTRAPGRGQWPCVSGRIR